MSSDPVEAVKAALTAAPWGAPDERRRAEVRTAILAQAARMRRSRRPGARGTWVSVGAVAAAAAAAVLVVIPAATQREIGAGDETRGPSAAHPTKSIATSAEPAAASRGRVRPSAGAVIERSGPVGDEIVRLRHGRAYFEVDRLDPGERFRVVAGDGEVEVRGTEFSVTVVDDRLIAVDVNHGRVEIRGRGIAAARPHALIEAGQSWRAPEGDESAVVGAPPAAPPAVAARVKPQAMDGGDGAACRTGDRHRPRPTSAGASPAPGARDAAFEEGWLALKGGEHGRAVMAFERAAAMAAGDPLAEDAAYWRAVALARGARRAEAISALTVFVDEHGSSPRAGEAAALLGWQLLAFGNLDEAERRFGAALSDRSPTVRRSAQDGLRAVLQRRTAGR